MAKARAGILLMWSVPVGSFDRLASLENLWRVWRCYRAGKSRRPNVAHFDLEADREICRLHRLLESARYEPRPHRLSVVFEPKPRLVAAPAMPDRIVQQALLAEIAPTYERSFLDQSFACGTGRGTHRALLLFLDFSRRFRFRLKLDIRRYFASVDHAILEGLFSRRLQDERTFHLVRQFIRSGGEVYRTRLAEKTLGRSAESGRGLALGGFFSHWSGALYLDGLDHFIKRQLKIPGYLRYMDDFVLFADDRLRLDYAFREVVRWLLEERRLELSTPDAEVLPSANPSTFLGMRVTRAGFTPGSKMRKRMRSKLRLRWNAKPKALTRCLISYRGLLTTL